MTGPGRTESGGDDGTSEAGPNDDAQGPDRRGRLAGVWTLVKSLALVLRSPGEDLSQRVAHGGMWQVIQRGASGGISLVRMVVLARLLAPEDFGLFAIAVLTQQTLDTLLRFGVDAKLIHEAEDTERLLNTAWTVKLVKAGLVAVGLLLAAPFVAAFFDAPRATPLIRVLSCVVLIEGLQNIGVVYFRKELELRKQFALDFYSSLVNLLVAVPAALVLGSAWALLLGILAAAFTVLVLSYVLHTYRPVLEFSRTKVGEIIDFGKWIFGSGALVFVSTNGDDILLGRWLGAASLGVYQVAYRISNTVATEVTHVISGVTFPAYAKLQSSPERLRDGFLSALSVTAMIAVPLAAAIMIFIPHFVRHVIGDHWMAAIGPVRILALAGLVRALSACWGPLYLAQGRTENAFWKNSLRAVFTLGPAFPLTMVYGINGMSFCVLVGIGAAMLYDLWWSATRREAGIGVRELWRACSEPILGSLVASTLVLGTQKMVGESLSAFLALAGAFLATYGATLLSLERKGRATGIRELATLLRRP